MNRRLYNIILGSLLLTGLYFELNYLIYILIGIVLIESITNILLPKYLARIPISMLNDDMNSSSSINNSPYKINFSADRMWRLLIGVLLIVSFIFYFQFLWFIPWFLGFAILGAGVSDVCPILEFIRYIGFKR